MANLLQMFSLKKNAAPEQPSATQESSARPVAGTDKGPASPDKGALFLDISGKIVSAQPRCAGFFGRQPEELVGLNLKDLLNPDYHQQLTNALKKGQNAGVQSFPAVALRKDSPEFPTQLAIKFLSGIPSYCWTVFVQAPPGYPPPKDHESSNARKVPDPQPSPESKPPAELKPSAELKPPAELKLAAEPKPSADLKPHSQTAESTAGVDQEVQNLRKRAEENETARKLLVTDLELVRNSNKLLRKKEDELNAQLQKLQAAVAQAETRARESATQSKDWENKAADFKKNIDRLTRAQSGSQSADVQSTFRVEELEKQLEDVKTKTEKLEVDNRLLIDANIKTKAHLKDEREANKLAKHMAEELYTRIRKLEDALHAAEVRARESAPLSRDSEKKADDLKKNAPGKNADAQSTQRVKDLELQLKDANASVAAARTKAEKLEAENRQLNETNTKTKADLDHERDANKVAKQMGEELHAQIRKLQDTADKAEVRARESAALSRDWEKKVDDLKKNLDELTRSQAAGKNADAQSAQRLKELERQLKDANAGVATAKTEAEKLQAENRQLNEANSKTKADLDKERDANKLARQTGEELRTQVRKLQDVADKAEVRANDSAAQSRHWEKKATDLKKDIDELTRNHAAGKSADAQSAQRIKQLEQHLNEANTSLTAAKAEAEKHNSARQRLEAENRNLSETNAKAKDDLAKECDAKKLSQKEKEELGAQIQKLKSAAEQAEAQSKEWEKKAADLKKDVDELSRSHAAGKDADAKSAKRVKELEHQLNEANASLAAAKTEAEKQNSARQQLEAENRKVADTNAKAKDDLEKERDAKKLAQKEKEELNVQLQKLKDAAEQAEARARESAAQCNDLEKKAAVLKKNLDELTRSNAAVKNADTQTAQRLKQLEQQLNEANASLTAAKTETEKQKSARQRLENENRNLAETNAKAKDDFEKERDAKKIWQKEKEELSAQVQKLKGAAEQAETHARESAAHSKDWERKAADLKSSVDELTRSHTADKNATAQATQRVKELEQYLKDANANLAAANAKAEKLAAENRQLNEASTRVKPGSTHSAERMALLERKIGELEERVQEGILEKKIGELENRVREGTAKVTAGLEGQRAERERAENNVSSAADQWEELKGCPDTEILENLIEAFKLHGYDICKDGTYKKGIEKIAIYTKNGRPTHVARQLESGLWTSKFRLSEDLPNDSSQLVKDDVHARTLMQRRRDRKPSLKDRLFGKL